MPEEERSREVLAFDTAQRQHSVGTAPAPEAGPGRAPADAAGTLQRIYDAHAAQIYRFIYRKVGNREDAEDLTAQVFMKAAQSFNAAREEQGQMAWLYQVARTTIADHWRDYYRGNAVSLDALQEDYGFQDIAADPHQGAAVAEAQDPAMRQVEAILGQLPENYRQVLHYRFLKGYSLKETAAAMQISEGNVKVLQYRALQKAGNRSASRGGS